MAKVYLSSVDSVKPVDLGKSIPATPAERHMAAKYLRITKGERGWQVWLRVDHQSFTVGMMSDTRYHARWRCWQLAKAMLKMSPK